MEEDCRLAVNIKMNFLAGKAICNETFVDRFHHNDSNTFVISTFPLGLHVRSYFLTVRGIF